jgi:hypothetical protein
MQHVLQRCAERVAAWSDPTYGPIEVYALRVGAAEAGAACK